MESKAVVALVAGLMVSAAVASGQGRGTPPPPAADTVAPAIPGVVAAGATVHVIRDGFNGSEGTITLPDGSVIFSETAANRTIKIETDDTVSVFLENTSGSNGMSFDRDGRLFVTQVPFGTGGVAIIYPAAARRMLVDRYDGKPFGRANDLTVARNGGVYFTDSANAQPMPAAGVPLPPALYYLVPGASSAAQVVTGVTFPNGVVLSADERTLYLNDTNGEYMIAFDVRPDGALVNRRNFAKYDGVTPNAAGVPVSGADGLTLDNDGRLYAACANGVQVFDTEGRHLGTIPMPRPPQNLSFAGSDKRTLYVVGRGVASRVSMLARGLAQRPR
ncbi:MAG TPA: SMP-30/gluconolactonase/LRE family protein [Vicinamibacterales bacterium]|nr:SMP-30/gluconolactonase/LRE family protein [Vicinamibacterales bacterium]